VTVYPHPREFLPQQGQAAMLAAVVSASSEEVRCRVVGGVGIPPEWDTPEGVPIAVGIEYMAQTIAAFGALEGRGPVRPGLIASLRGLTIRCRGLERGAPLIASARPRAASELASIFECTLATEGGAVLLEGTICIAHPEFT